MFRINYFRETPVCEASIGKLNIAITEIKN